MIGEPLAQGEEGAQLVRDGQQEASVGLDSRDDKDNTERVSVKRIALIAM
jgi:hypothetical protein